MRYIFIVLFAAMFCVFAYWSGERVGLQKCRADASNTALKGQFQIIQQQEKINAETYHTGTGDIRRVLREKYSISD